MIVFLMLMSTGASMVGCMSEAAVHFKSHYGIESNTTYTALYIIVLHSIIRWNGNGPAKPKVPRSGPV